MNPRKPLILWQHFAHAFGRVQSAFASDPGLSQSGLVGMAASCGTAPTCDPFPMIWPSPFGVGSFFAPDCAAPGPRLISAGHGILPFVFAKAALESDAITTTNRGKTSCRNSSHFFLSPPRLRAVFKTLAALLPCAPLAVPRQARLSPMRPAVAKPRARLLALSSAACLAVSPACPSAEPFDLTALAAGLSTKPAIQRGSPFGWLFHFARPVARPI